MTERPNPILRALKSSNPTPKEITEGLLAIMDAHAELEEDPTKPKAELIMLAETVEEAEKVRELDKAGKLRGLSTGFPSLDKMTKGFAPGEIIVLFGDTGHGKSQLAQAITINIAKTGTAVLFVGLEMVGSENTVRFLDMVAGSADPMKLPILYPAQTDAGFKDIETLVRTASEQGVKLCVFDHLHAMSLSGATNKADAYEETMYEFKRVARKYAMPTVVISHINGSAASDSPPELKDLKGSTAIKQCADFALAVWRDTDFDGEPMEELHVFLRKARRGSQVWSAKFRIVNGIRLIDPAVAPTV